MLKRKGHVLAVIVAVAAGGWLVVGKRGWVSRWVIPLSRQIRSNSTSPPLPNRSVNWLPLSVKTSPGTPTAPPG